MLQISHKSAQFFPIATLLAEDLLTCVLSRHALTKTLVQCTLDLCPILLIVGQKVPEDLA